MTRTWPSATTAAAACAVSSPTGGRPKNSWSIFTPTRSPQKWRTRHASNPPTPRAQSPSTTPSRNVVVRALPRLTWLHPRPPLPRPAASRRTGAAAMKIRPRPRPLPQTMIQLPLRCLHSAPYASSSKTTSTCTSSSRRPGANSWPGELTPTSTRFCASSKLNSMQTARTLAWPRFIAAQTSTTRNSHRLRAFKLVQPRVSL